ncbi:MAG TPA: cytochrome c3 family protein [Hyphomicrobiales bacterium]|nr:cytochrome c3 family protein [Hyphomicrobiales bacterium]
MQIFRPRANVIARSVLIAGALLPFLAIGVTYGIMNSSYVTEQEVIKGQPVPFSHKHHAGELGIGCLYCHTGVEKSGFAGLPATHICMTCHSQLWTNAAMLAPVRESLATNRPIRWNRVNILPAYVYFNHSVHIAKGVGCSTCHGRIDQMALTAQGAPLTMGWCVDCHSDPAPNLREPSQVFDMEWQPAPGQDRRGAELMNANRINPSRLIECSTCHR